MECTCRILQVLLANVLVKIGAVFTVALPLVWLGGLLYHCTSGESLQISLFKVYAVLYRAPGSSPGPCAILKLTDRQPSMPMALHKAARHKASCVVAPSCHCSWCDLDAAQICAHCALLCAQSHAAY